MRVDHILSKMHGGFEARMRTQQKYKWRNNNPMVQEHIAKVKEHTSQKRPRCEISLADERKFKIKKERSKTRMKNISTMKKEVPRLYEDAVR